MQLSNTIITRASQSLHPSWKIPPVLLACISREYRRVHIREYCYKARSNFECCCGNGSWILWPIWVELITCHSFFHQELYPNHPKYPETCRVPHQKCMRRPWRNSETARRIPWRQVTIQLPIKKVLRGQIADLPVNHLLQAIDHLPGRLGGKTRKRKFRSPGRPPLCKMPFETTDHTTHLRRIKSLMRSTILSQSLPTPSSRKNLDGSSSSEPGQPHSELRKF